MKNIRFSKFLCVALLLCGTFGFWVSGAFSASTPDTASTSGITSVTFIQPLGLANDVNLDFGRFSGDGTITVDAGTGATAPGPGMRVQVITQGVRGRMIVGGAGGSLFTVQSVTPSIMLSGPGGSLMVDLNVFAPTNAFSGAPGAVGSADVFIGGVLTIPPGIAEGAYTGTYSIQVNNG